TSARLNSIRASYRSDWSKSSRPGCSGPALSVVAKLDAVSVRIAHVDRRAVAARAGKRHRPGLDLDACARQTSEQWLPFVRLEGKTEVVEVRIRRGRALRGCGARPHRGREKVDERGLADACTRKQRRAAAVFVHAMRRETDHVEIKREHCLHVAHGENNMVECELHRRFPPAFALFCLFPRPRGHAAWSHQAQVRVSWRKTCTCPRFSSG